VNSSDERLRRPSLSLQVKPHDFLIVSEAATEKQRRGSIQLPIQSRNYLGVDRASDADSTQLAFRRGSRRIAFDHSDDNMWELHFTWLILMVSCGIVWGFDWRFVPSREHWDCTSVQGSSIKDVRPKIAPLWLPLVQIRSFWREPPKPFTDVRVVNVRNAKYFVFRMTFTRQRSGRPGARQDGGVFETRNILHFGLKYFAFLDVLFMPDDTPPPTPSADFYICLTFPPPIWPDVFDGWLLLVFRLFQKGITRVHLTLMSRHSKFAKWEPRPTVTKHNLYEKWGGS